MLSFIAYRDKIVDFHWNASDPWTIVSVSDDCDSTGGGGTLQVTGCLLSCNRILFKVFSECCKCSNDTSYKVKFRRAHFENT